MIKKRFYYLFALLTFCSTTLFAQSQWCGTVPTTQQINYMNSFNAARLNFAAQQKNNTAAFAITYVPVTAHILRQTAGTGGLSVANLNTTIDSLNKYYLPANIQFFLCGSINYIDNTTYYDFDENQETALTSANDVSNTINIYFNFDWIWMVISIVTRDGC